MGDKIYWQKQPASLKEKAELRTSLVVTQRRFPNDEISVLEKDEDRMSYLFIQQRLMNNGAFRGSRGFQGTLRHGLS